MKRHYIGVFGMMGSGKSVLINEFIHERDHAEISKFIPPPVEAKFRGMDFEFVDQIFAVERDGILYNFFELDAPTINKWTQFIEITDAIIIAYNYTKDDYFESPLKFIANIKSYTTPEVPIYIVVNNCDDIDAATNRLEEVFDLSNQLRGYQVDIRVIPTAEIEYTKEHGRRVMVEISRLDELYESVIDKLNQK